MVELHHPQHRFSMVYLVLSECAVLPHRCEAVKIKLKKCALGRTRTCMNYIKC